MDDFVSVNMRTAQVIPGLAVVAGLVCLGLFLWHIAPPVALIVLCPALVACFVPLVTAPVYGLRICGAHWRVFQGRTEHAVDAADIAYLVVGRQRPGDPVTLVLKDGREIDIPVAATDAPLGLIREAIRRDVTVRLR